MFISKATIRIVTVLPLFCAVTQIDAQTVAAFHNGGGTFFNHHGSVGWWFELTDPVTVTHLGIFDSGDPGLVDSHDVGIFARSGKGTALGVVVVPSGTSAVLVDGTRFVELTTSVSLLAGVDYYVLANNWQNDQAIAEFGGAAISYAPVVIQKGQSVEPTNNILNPEVQNTTGGEILGPNFMIEGVPEPSSVVGLAVAAGVFALARRRSRLGSRS